MKTQNFCNKSINLKNYNNHKSEPLTSNNISKKFPSKKILLNLLEGDSLLKSKFTLSNFLNKKQYLEDFSSKNLNLFSSSETNNTFLDDPEKEKKEVINELDSDSCEKEVIRHVRLCDSSDISD